MAPRLPATQVTSNQNVEYIERFGRLPATFFSLASNGVDVTPGDCSASISNGEKLSNSRRVAGVAGNSSDRRATATVAGNRKSYSSKKAVAVLDILHISKTSFGATSERLASERLSPARAEMREGASS